MNSVSIAEFEQVHVNWEVFFFNLSLSYTVTTVTNNKF